MSISRGKINGVPVWCSHDEIISIEKIIPNPRNPNTHPPHQIEMLANIIQNQGIRAPISISKRSGMVVRGHGRRLAAIRAGIDAFPVEYQEYESDGAEWSDLVADNRIAELAEINDGLIKSILSDIDLDHFDLSMTGFDTDDIDKILGGEEQIPGNTDEDDVPDAPNVPTTRPGDLWLLGRHRLLCGDSTNQYDVQKLLAGEKIDICFNSPPYGMDRSAGLRDHYVRGKTKRQTLYLNHEDTQKDWYDLMSSWYSVFFPVCGCIICNIQMLANNKKNMIKWIYDRSEDFIDLIIWDKLNSAPQMAKKVLSNEFEFIFIFGSTGTRSIPFANFHGTISNVFRLSTREKKDFSNIHRAVFPVGLPVWIIKDLCSESKTITDPFCGTGTTIIAAEQLNRACFGMEIDPIYCDVAVKRWENYTGQKAIVQK